MPTNVRHLRGVVRVALVAHMCTGNEAFRQKRFELAAEHYEKALGICNFVRGMTRPDQEEIDKNKVRNNNNRTITNKC